MALVFGVVCCWCCFWCCCYCCFFRCCCCSCGCCRCQRQHNHRRVLLTLLADDSQTENTANRTHNSNPGAQFAQRHVNETVETNATDPLPKGHPSSNPWTIFRPTHCQLSCGLNASLPLCFPFYFSAVCLISFINKPRSAGFHPSCPSWYPLVASPTLNCLSTIGACRRPFVIASLFDLLPSLLITNTYVLKLIETIPLLNFCFFSAYFFIGQHYVQGTIAYYR